MYVCTWPLSKVRQPSIISFHFRVILFGFHRVCLCAAEKCDNQIKSTTSTTNDDVDRVDDIKVTTMRALAGRVAGGDYGNTILVRLVLKSAYV